MASHYFSGTATLTVEYDRLADNEYDDYFDFGLRTNSENPFKVYINGQEAQNESPAATVVLGEEKVGSQKLLRPPLPLPALRAWK